MFSPLVTSLGWRLTSLILAAPSLPIGLAFLVYHGNLEHPDSATRPKVNPAKSKSLILFYLARMAQIFGGVAIGFFLPLFAVTLPLPLLTIFVLLTALGFSGSGTWPPQNVWLNRVTSEKTPGKTFGGVISLVNLAQVFSPLLFGFLADEWGLISAFRWAILPIAVRVLCLGRLVSKE